MKKGGRMAISIRGMVPLGRGGGPLSRMAMSPADTTPATPPMRIRLVLQGASWASVCSALASVLSPLSTPWPSRQPQVSPFALALALAPERGQGGAAGLLVLLLLLLLLLPLPMEGAEGGSTTSTCVCTDFPPAIPAWLHSPLPTLLVPTRACCRRLSDSSRLRTAGGALQQLRLLLRCASS